MAKDKLYTGQLTIVLHKIRTATCRVGVFSLMVVSKRAVHLFAFLGFNLPQVELQFFALKDIAVGPATLSRSGCNAGWRETTID